MPDMNQKLDRFTAKILAEAADESKRALAEVKRRRELRFQEAEDAALKEAYEYIHGEVARIQSEAGRGVSRHMLENKRALYLRRTEMAQEVFALVRAKSPPSPALPPMASGSLPCWPRRWSSSPARRRCWLPCGATI